MKYLITCITIILTFNTEAAPGKYPVAAIPDSLKERAHAVIRSDRSVLTVHSARSVSWKRHYAITVLNSNGDGEARMVAAYDKLRKIGAIEGNLYDQNGKLIRKLKSKEVSDVTGVDDNNLMDDSRIKTHHFMHHNYPYTVEYIYEITYSHTFQFPAWLPVNSENVSLESASLVVQYPSDFNMRYNTFNLAEKPMAGSSAKFQSLKWKLENQKSLQMPQHFAFWRNAIPVVFLAPSEFQLDQITGNMSTWKDFGLFIYQLTKEKQALPKSIRQRVKELTQNLQSDHEKIKILYRYMQANTRYVSVQLGLGGWIPFDAAYVAERGYGDCKALTNYMQALLSEAGIKSYYTLVYAGRQAMDRNWVTPEFSSNQFNHVILCIPGGKDTTWLECTSQILPAGYLGSATSNRSVLLVSEEGGHLVSSPHYGLDESKLIRKIHAVIAEDGTAKLKMEAQYTGPRQDVMFSLTQSMPKPKVKEYLQRSIALPTFDINHFEYKQHDSTLPVLTESLDVTSLNYGTFSGKRLFVTPNILSKHPFLLRHEKGRTADFNFESEYRDEDEVEIELPQGYRMETAIRPVELKTQFGYYKAECKVVDNRVYYHRIFEQYHTVLPASNQEQVLSFFKTVYDSDRARLVFVKADEGKR